MNANVVIRPAERLLPMKVEQRLRNELLDKFTGNFILNIKDGRVMGFHITEIVMLTSAETST